MAKRGLRWVLLEFFCDRAGNELQLKHDVIFQVETGGTHGSQRVATEPLGIFLGAFDPKLQLALDFVEPVEEAIWSSRGSLATAQIKYLKEHDGSIVLVREKKLFFLRFTLWVT